MAISRSVVTAKASLRDAAPAGKAGDRRGETCAVRLRFEPDDLTDGA
jgi:hypothetical protein